MRELPPAPGPGAAEVRVSVALAPVHRGDLVGVETAPDGTFAPRPLGSEGAGTVTAVGESVRGLSVGDRVAVFPAQGAWSQQVTVPAEAAVAVSASTSDEVAAVTLVNGITSRQVLRVVDEVRTEAGATADTPLIVSAPASAVGKLIVRQALDGGVPVIAVGRSERSAATVRSLFPGCRLSSPDTRGGRTACVSSPGDAECRMITDAHGGEFVSEILPFLADADTLVVWGT